MYDQASLRRSRRLRALPASDDSPDLAEVGQLGAGSCERIDGDAHRKTSDGATNQSKWSLRAPKAPKMSQYFSPRRSMTLTATRHSKAQKADIMTEAVFSTPKQAKSPEASLFPTLVFRLHGIASDDKDFFGLVQEIITPDVFGMVVVTVLLNQTTGRAAIPVFYALLHRWPTPSLLADADLTELTDLLQPIGLHNIRAARLKNIGRTWCESPPALGFLHKSRVAAMGDTKRKRQAATSSPDGKRLGDVYPPTEISHLPGVGRYALDSFRIFRPSLIAPERAAVQVGVCGVKPQSAKWEEILQRRLDVGESRCVGSLLPGDHSVDAKPSPPYLESDWQNVDPLDKELKAYLIWRMRRDMELGGMPKANKVS